MNIDTLERYKIGDCISGDCNNGYGTCIYSIGGKYIGEFKNNKRDGIGTITLANGDKYSGAWKNNEKHTYKNSLR